MRTTDYRTYKPNDYRNKIIKCVQKFWQTIFVIALLLVTSCGEKKAQSPQPIPEGEVKLVAVVTKPDGSKEFQFVLRVIRKSVGFDSVTGKDIVVVDTLYGRPQLVPATDSLGKEKIDSATGKKVMTEVYFKIGKDSVNANVANVSVDSLLKK